MKAKILNFLLIITSLFGYLEWSGNSHAFLFQVEAEIFSKTLTDPISVIHPFTVLPLTGQVLLIFSLFQRLPNKTLTYVGIGSLGILLGFILVIGLISMNYKIFFSTIPFVIVSVLTIRHHKKMAKYNKQESRTANIV